MSGNFSIGKSKDRAHEKDIEDILKVSEYLKSRFEELIDKDVDAFLKLKSALKNKSGNDILQMCYKESASVPLEICKLSYGGLKSCPILADWGNPALISDVGIAEEFFETAFNAGKLNVDINLNFIQDEKFIKDLKKDLTDIEKHIKALKKAVTIKVKDVLYEKY